MDNCWLDPGEQISFRFWLNTYVFIQENVFENVVSNGSGIL